MKILIIEDELSLLELMSRTLSKEGYAVECAKTLISAKEKIAIYNYDCILLDITKVATYKHSAWFDNTGKWHMTETDITFEQLPEAVKTSFKSSEYATWRIEDVDKIERNSVEIVYVIEIEQVVNKIETEIDLYYSEDGILVKKVTDVDNDNDDDDDYEDYIPSTPSNNISDYINKFYPNARIIDIDHEKSINLQ